MLGMHQPGAEGVAVGNGEKDEPGLSPKDEWGKTFDAITDIITIQDPDMRITRANQAAGHIFGVHPQELIGRYCYELFRGSRSPCSGCPVTETIQNQSPRSAEIYHPSLRKTFAVSTSPILDDDGRVLRIIHWAKDITDKKNLQQQLLQAQKMEAIGTLAAGIAHDFNNILTAIIGYSELAGDTLPSNHQAARDIAAIQEAGQRARTLVQQILTIGRKTEPTLEPLLLQPIIREAAQLLRASLPRTIGIVLDLDESCGPVLIDSGQIHQVVMNLCTNAYHAMRAMGGTLHIALDAIALGREDLVHTIDLAEGSHARLRINDTGSGIAREHLERIFDPYFSTKKKGEGTGLGLSVVHSIVKNHGGQITVDSHAGGGSTFTVYLPQCKSHQPRESTPVEQHPPGGSEHILLLDDEEQVIDVHGRFLQSLGYRVEGYTRCKDAILAFRAAASSYDLVITDMTMPYLTGIEFAEEIRQHRRDIPIIACTGFSDSINMKNAWAFGIGKLLMKPATLSELGTAVRELLDEINH